MTFYKQGFLSTSGTKKTQMHECLAERYLKYKEVDRTTDSVSLFFTVYSTPVTFKSDFFMLLSFCGTTDILI